MKEDFSHNELEKKLKKEADQFTLSPSEEVWNRINEQLHPRRDRRAWLWAAAALLGLFLASYVIWRSQTSSVSLDEPASGTSRRPAGTDRVEIKPGTDSAKSSRASGIAAVPQTRNVSEPVRTETDTVVGENKVAANTLTRTENKHSNRIYPLKERPWPDHAQKAAGHAFIHRQLPFLPGISAAAAGGAIGTAFSFGEIALAPMQEWAMQTGSPATGPLEDPLDLQMSGKKTKEKRKPSFEVYFTLGRSYRVLTMPDGAAASRQMDNLLSGFAVVTNNKIDHKPNWGFSAGFLGIFPLADHWSLETGLSVERVGYRVKAFGSYPASVGGNGNYSLASPSSANRANSFYVTSAFTGRAAREPAYIHNSYLYGQVPLLVSYRFGAENKFHINVAAGGGLLYLFRSSPVTFAPESGRYFADKDLLRPFNASLQAGVEAVFPISRHISFILGPGIQYQLFSTYKDYPQVKEHPYLPGIKVGLRWLQ